jgi:hypothetical protein
MLIVLHKHVSERNLHRFYALQVTPNLFGTWSRFRPCGRAMDNPRPATIVEWQPNTDRMAGARGIRS